MHLIQRFRESLGRLRGTLLTRIQSELSLTITDPSALQSKVAEADKAITDGTILEWLVANLPALVAEVGPLIQAILTLLTILG